MPKFDWIKQNLSLADDDIENWKNEGLKGFYFSSDKTKEKELFFITVEKFRKIVEKVITDLIVRKEYKEDKLIVNSRKSK